MRTGLSWFLGACLFAAGPAFAQSPLRLPDLDGTTMPSLAPAQGQAGAAQAVQPAQVSQETPIPPVDPPPADSGLLAPGGSLEPYRVWANAEYLLFFVKNAPTPVPLVTGSNPNNPTQSVFGSDQNLGVFSGMRFQLGSWLDPASSVGVEATFFLLERRSATSGIASDAGGSPTLQWSFANQTPGAAGANLMPIAYPGVFAGSASITSTLQLWGAEANGVFVLVPRQAGFELVGIAGFRYVDLLENLNIGTMSSDMLTAPNTVLSQTDHFGTRNQFYGGQLGARLNLEGERFSFDMTAKLAIGMTHQSLDVQGSSTQTGPGGPTGTFPGGFFTQSSNIGRFAGNDFGFIPDIELKLHYFITPRWSVFIGYDFMYWNSVIRPGSQIDRNINLTQSAVLGNGALIGPGFPAQQFNRTDFWAQGINFGFEFRY